MAKNFSEKYAHLKPNGGDIPVTRLENYPHHHQLPEGYGRGWVHPENGFVKQFCEEYDSSEEGDTQDE